MKMQFFARSFCTFILILPIIPAKHHTFSHYFRQDGDFVTKANSTECDMNEK